MYSCENGKIISRKIQHSATPLPTKSNEIPRILQITKYLREIATQDTNPSKFTFHKETYYLSSPTMPHVNQELPETPAMEEHTPDGHHRPRRREATDLSHFLIN